MSSDVEDPRIAIGIARRLTAETAKSTAPSSRAFASAHISRATAAP